MDLESKCITGAIALLVATWIAVMMMTGESFWDFQIESSDRLKTPTLTVKTTDLP